MTIPPIELAAFILIAALAGLVGAWIGYLVGWSHGYRHGYRTAERIAGKRMALPLQKLNLRAAEVEAKFSEYADRVDELLGVRS
ncbi:MAG: hypothetical protein M0R37_12775 [Bacteroidales bacterium]|nr:hypothetical protein [Bacteroidales bacterium]